MKKVIPTELAEKWAKTGLLDGVKKKNDRILLAQNLEITAWKLIRVKDTDKNKEIKAGLFLPIMRRLFDEKKVRVVKNIHPIWLKFNKFFDTNYKTFMDIGRFHALDGEAEFCSRFVEFYEEL